MYDLGTIVKVNNPMQRGYQYQLSAPMGANFCPSFEPHYSPKEMLTKGVFEGKYLNSCHSEYPSDWFLEAKLSANPDSKLNFFGIKSRQSISVWREKGWILSLDPRGWFEWYCRYFLGRRHQEMDEIQIKRWRGFKRHAGQVRANCEPGDLLCRPRQRQALLQWSHDPFI